MNQLSILIALKSTNNMKKIAVFVSGRGSNLKSVFNGSKNPESNYRIEYVVADKECLAIDFAKENQIQTLLVSKEKKTNYVTFLNLIEIFSNKVDLIVLAGFLKKIPEELVHKFTNKIVNIHPALLPLFGGKGMYGMNVHSAVFESGMKISGATVHFVNEEFDKGPIICQKAADISNCNSPEEIALKVLEIEHEILPIAIKKILENELVIEKNRIRIL